MLFLSFFPEGTTLKAGKVLGVGRKPLYHSYKMKKTRIFEDVISYSFSQAIQGAF